MFSLFFARYGFKILGILIMLGGLYSIGYVAYKYVFDIAYKQVSGVYEKRIKDYESALLSRIDVIEQNSTLIIQQNETLREEAKKDFLAILKATKGRPLYTIQAGVCTPSKEFVDVYNDAITRANKQ